MKRTSSSIVVNIDAIAGEQESKVMKHCMTSKVDHYSHNQPSQHYVHFICKADINECCKCHIALFLWQDGFYYLDHTTTNLTYNSHPKFTPDAKLRGIRYTNNQSKLLIEHSLPHYWRFSMTQMVHINQQQLKIASKV